MLDIGCGTGLNFPLLLAGVGRKGHVVGVDKSHEMLKIARQKMAHAPPGNLSLIEANAEQLDHPLDGLHGLDHTAELFDAVLFTYSLSLMNDWEDAWERATVLVRPGGRVGVVDVDVPNGWARLLDPAARLACLVGGANINARPWTLLEETCVDLQSWSLRGGHVQVRVGTLSL